MTKLKLTIRIFGNYVLLAILVNQFCLAQMLPDQPKPAAANPEVESNTQLSQSPAMSMDAELASTFRAAAGQQKAGHLEKAAQLYRQILSQRPHLAEAHNNLALIYQTIGEQTLARQEYDEAIQQVPNYGVALNNYAALLFSAGEYSKARDLWIRAAKSDVLNSDYLFNLALCCLKTAEPETALRYVRLALKLNPQQSAAYCLEGRLLRARGDLLEALQSYQNSLASAAASGAPVMEEAKMQVEELKALLGAANSKPVPPPVAKPAQPAQSAMAPKTSSKLPERKKNKNKILSAFNYIASPFRGLFSHHKPIAVAAQGDTIDAVSNPGQPAPGQSGIPR
jgi:Tfp pilus assembly protein PilF